ncbi:MAG: hypothetical protein LBC56_07115 [Oscillospiraceae bacterium]|jgi:hypothetical protein|nr:hypothetical protein [Oscillospiraceae bacterium]
MKTRAFIICACALIFLLCACGEPEPEMSPYRKVNDLSGVAMSVKKGTAKPAGAEVSLANANEKDCISGEFFAVERKYGDGWAIIDTLPAGDIAWRDIAYIIPGGGLLEMPIDWNYLYGELKPGRYRIVKEFYYTSGDGQPDRYYLTAEFKI